MVELQARGAALGGDLAASFQRRLGGLRRRANAGKDVRRAVRAVAEDLSRLEAGREARDGLSLVPTYEDLPIVEARDRILDTLRSHPVLILAGATGSGKTTQLPKMCLEIGRGLGGMIAHTQPRRVAARSVAARIAEELGTPVGAGVGCAVRFERTTSPTTRIKVMTDGILLAETSRDRDLLAYDTIIVDEAHERSLNIDFLLGYLKQLRRRRSDLKIVITSATIDLERFSRHFDDAPVIEVSGRTYPVETRYRPVTQEDPAEEGDPASILDAIGEIDRGPTGRQDPSGRPDVLVFLPGEREIRETAEVLDAAGLPETEVVPLYARLSNEQQDRVFRPGPLRRVVLATNVAETSLTVPRIRAVIDSGLARISRYSPKSRVQRLPIEPISKASADQRSGRCGRLSPGVCIRLYGEEDFEARPAFTAPEILRSSLASVVLRMADLGLGDPMDFPFVDPPSAKLLRDGYATLRELNAVDSQDAITPAGRRLAELPVDPRIGRMILASAEEGCLAEVLVIASALTVPDPRDGRAGGGRRTGPQVFRDPRSDFLGYLRLWKAWQEARDSKGSSALRTWCRRHELSYRRLQEWQSLEEQLRDLAGRSILERGTTRRGRRSPSIPPLQEECPAGAVHRSILSGLIAHVGRKQEDGSYRGIGGGTFQIFPGSVLSRERPEWIVCAEIVETSRRWGRTCARIRADWIERVAPHLVRKTHYEPHFVPDTGFVCAYERVSCGELDPTERRRVPFAAIDPVGARQVFIQEALVGERLPDQPTFLDRNREIRAEIREVGDRLREDHLIDEDVRRFEFYDRRLPEDIHNVAAFDAWRRRAERRDPAILEMTAADFGEIGASGVASADYPDHLEIGGQRVDLTYRHEPGHPEDGVSARIPIELLGRLDATRFEWLVPGLLADKCEALVRALPKRIRTRLMPIRDIASGAADHLDATDAGLLDSLADYLSTIADLRIRPTDFRVELLEPHHSIRFVLVGDDGSPLDSGRDYQQLLRRHHSESRRAFETVAAETSDDEEAQRLGGIQDRETWDFDDVPTTIMIRRSHGEIAAFPAITDRGSSVSIRLTDDQRSAEAIHRRGVRRLLALSHRAALRHHLDHLPGADALADRLTALRIESTLDHALGDLCIQTILSGRVDLEKVRSGGDFNALDDLVHRELWPGLERAVDALTPILEEVARLDEVLSSPSPAAWSEAIEEERRHRAELIVPDFLASTPLTALRTLPRYLEVGRRRLEGLRGDGVLRDAPRAREFSGWWRLYLDRRRELDSLGRSDPDLEEFRWRLEDYRVQLHAPGLARGRRVSVSDLKAMWQAIGG